MFEPPLPQHWPWLAILFILLFVYLVATEIQSQDCDNRRCYNTTPIPSSDDTTRDMIDKIITTARINHNPVEWRKALLIGFIVSLVTLIAFGRLNLRNFVLIGLIVFILVYFAATWLNWIYWRQVDVTIEKSLLHLRMSTS